jgi:hypothetical protein
MTFSTRFAIAYAKIITSGGGMKSHWIDHKGKRVFITDFSRMGSNAESLQEEALAVIEALKHEQPNSIRAITNVEHTIANENTMRILRETLPHTNPFVRVRAVVGVHGFRKHLVAAFTRLTGRAEFIIFETMEEALDWIVNQ